MAKSQRTLQAGEALQGLLDRNTQYGLIHVGMITQIDYEKNIISVMAWEASGGAINIPLSHPAAGSAYIMSMPKKGDFVLYGYRKQNMKSATPIVLSYLPASFPLQKEFGKGTNNRFHYEKLYPGEIGLASDAGATIRLDKSVRLSDGYLREFGINADTGKFFMDVDGQNIHTGGVKLLSGAVMRDGVENSPLFSDVEFPISESGRILTYITRNNVPISGIDFAGGTEVAPVFSEFRIEAMDGTNLTRSPEEFRENLKAERTSPSVSNQPVIEFVLGNNIGNRPGAVYGKPFRLNIFGPGSIEPNVTDSILNNTSLNDEISNIMPTYFLRLPSSGLNTPHTAVAIDKEGQYFAHFTASKKHPNGPGNSAEIATEGRVRLFLGANPDGQSIQSKFVGGIDVVLGKSVEDAKSISINASGSINTISRADTTGVARYAEVIGDDIEIVHGTKTTFYKAPYSVKYPTKVENVDGSSSQAVGGGAQYTYGSNVDSNVAGTESRNIVRGRATVIATPSDSGFAESLQVLAGNVEEKITLGNKTVELVAGNYTESIVAGNRETSIIAGNYSVSTLAGNIDISTTVGNFTAETLAGLMTLSGVSTTLRGTANVAIQAPITTIGPAAGVPSGVITMLSHLDYIVGLPLRGSLTVLASV
jgi:hypothetical protein